MKIFLNECNWKVMGVWPYAPILGKSMELGYEILGTTPWIDASVPGGVHHDLIRAGLIEDPYFELNSLKCEWVEHRWWIYKTSFCIDKKFCDKKLSLLFRGVDYKAHFYLNGIKLGEHTGMFECVEFDVTGNIKSECDNELRVVLENAPQEMAQFGYTSKTMTQKSRFGYKWDFSTRLVNIGIWDDVLLKVTGNASFNDIFVPTDICDDKGMIYFSSNIDGEPGWEGTIKIDIYYQEKSINHVVEKVLLKNNGFRFSQNIIVENPMLWNPNGSGEQPLYFLKVSLYDINGCLSDEEEYYIGIRKLQYTRNENSPEDSLPYTVIVNNKPVYIKGVNIVPFDHLYGNVGKEIYDKYVLLLKNASVNLVRIWGGGIIEKEYFYHLCDLHGIMVWQEFIQSSSGIDNIPSVDGRFLELLKSTSEHAVKTKRNHVCHVIWSGGNELTDENGIPITYENPNIAMLKSIIEIYDPGKLFLPSSASGPNEFLDIEKPGSNHDVHGNWKYGGIKDHYHIFNNSDSLLHSEFGVDGLSSVLSLKRIMGENNLQPTDAGKNLIWRHHGEWWDTLARDREIFGQFESLQKFIIASQFIQAEGLRYIVEANRRRKFCNSGSIIWQFNEPWPNVSCTSLIEYYGFPKMAYYWVKKTYEPVHVSLKYKKIFYLPSEMFEGEIYIHNSLCEQELSVLYKVMDVYGNIVASDKMNLKVQENCVVRLADLKLKVPALKHNLFFVRLHVQNLRGNELCENTYLFSQMDEKIFSSLTALDKGIYSATKTMEGYLLKNTGKVVCLFIHGLLPSRKLIIDDNYLILFPGEVRMLNIMSTGPEACPRDSKEQVVWGVFND